MYHVTVNNTPKGINNQRLPCKFYYRQELNPARSANEGKQVFDNVLYLKISDNPYNIVDRRATEYDKVCYHKELAAFEVHNEQIINGTPLDVLFAPESNNAGLLRSNGIYTVEELAKSDHKFASKAQRYLDSMSEAGEFRKHEEEIFLRDQQIYALKEELKLLKAKFENYKASVERATNPDGFIDLNKVDKVGFDYQRVQIDTR